MLTTLIDIPDMRLKNGATADAYSRPDSLKHVDPYCRRRKIFNREKRRSVSRFISPLQARQRLMRAALDFPDTERGLSALMVDKNLTMTA